MKNRVLSKWRYYFFLFFGTISWKPESNETCSLLSVENVRVEILGPLLLSVTSFCTTEIERRTRCLARQKHGERTRRSAIRTNKEQVPRKEGGYLRLPSASLFLKYRCKQACARIKRARPALNMKYTLSLRC